jgi:hypothetical protein
VLGFEPGQPRSLIRAHQLGLGFLGQREKVNGVAVANGRNLAAPFELL